MGQIANVEYFKNYCNRKLGTNYSQNSKQAINLYWVVEAVKKVYNDLHRPKTNCKHPISTRFNLTENLGKVVVDTEFVHTVIDYLTYFKDVCWIQCACPCMNSTTATETCNNCRTCETCETCKTCKTCKPCTECPKDNPCTCTGMTCRDGPSGACLI